MGTLESFNIESWSQEISEDTKKRAVQSLEKGKVLYFPLLHFRLHTEEEKYLIPELVDPKSKNISFDIKNDRLAGTTSKGNEALGLKEMLKRFAIYSTQFLENLIPHYKSTLIKGKTSFRPVEIKGRKSSVRKDDTLLHVDSFPSNPTNGKRILRVFSNINLEGQPRIWRVGEPFDQVVQKMAPKVSRPFPGAAQILKTLGITKEKRSLYDHYMLQIHNMMKEDPDYQKSVQQEEIAFPAGSTWIVYTDQVSHAAMSGKDVLEQTFHLPQNGIKDIATNPLKVLEKYLNKNLI